MQRHSLRFNGITSELGGCPLAAIDQYGVNSHVRHPLILTTPSKHILYATS